MATILNNSQFQHDIYVNIGNLEDIYSLTIISLYSNKTLFSGSLSLLLTNDRYSHFAISITFDNNDLSGMYEYRIHDGDNIIDKGIVKIHTEREMTPTYISPNENCESIVYYRPN